MGRDFIIDETVESDVRVSRAAVLVHQIGVLVQKSVQTPDSDFPLGEKSVHFVNFVHEKSIAESEVRHVSPSLRRSHQLNQRFEPCVSAKSSTTPVARGYSRQVLAVGVTSEETTVCLVEFSVYLVGEKLLLEVPEFQSIDGHDLRTSSLPVISGSLIVVALLPFVTLGIARVFTVLFSACDNEALVTFQSFGKEARDNEFRVDDEPDLFLDQAMSCYSSTYKPVCEVHLQHPVAILLNRPLARDM